MAVCSFDCPSSLSCVYIDLAADVAVFESRRSLIDGKTGATGVLARAGIASYQHGASAASPSVRHGSERGPIKPGCEVATRNSADQIAEARQKTTLKKSWETVRFLAGSRGSRQVDVGSRCRYSRRRRWHKGGVFLIVRAGFAAARMGA
jgi:hypothetical protein